MGHLRRLTPFGATSSPDAGLGHAWVPFGTTPDGSTRRSLPRWLRPSHRPWATFAISEALASGPPQRAAHPLGPLRRSTPFGTTLSPDADLGPAWVPFGNAPDGSTRRSSPRRLRPSHQHRATFANFEAPRPRDPLGARRTPLGLFAARPPSAPPRHLAPASGPLWSPSAPPLTSPRDAHLHVGFDHPTNFGPPSLALKPLTSGPPRRAVHHLRQSTPFGATSSPDAVLRPARVPFGTTPDGSAKRSPPRRLRPSHRPQATFTSSGAPSAPFGVVDGLAPASLGPSKGHADFGTPRGDFGPMCAWAAV